MNARDNYGFQQLVEFCKQVHQEIAQTMSAELEMNRSNFLLNFLTKNNSIPCFQAYNYCSRLTGDEISQKSVNQFPRSCFKPIEFDVFRMQAEFLDSKLEREDNP